MPFAIGDFSARIYRSTDGGKTLVPVGGATLPERHREFEEHNVVELKDGTIHVTFDGDRFTKQAIFHVSFTEADVRRGGVLQSRVAPHARAPLPSSP